jgi:hypothetical protein
MPFFCRAVEIPKKSVEQLRFEQMDFEQLTLTRNSLQGKKAYDKEVLGSSYFSRTIHYACHLVDCR